MAPDPSGTSAAPAPEAAAVRSVLLAGGGSAGHVSPLLALADCLRRRDPAVQITALGTATGLEAQLVPARGYPLSTIEKVAFPRRPGPAAWAFPRSLARAVQGAADALERADAQVVVGFGGYVSTPAYLAARRRGVPIVIHEGNARPGLANRLGARLTRYVATTFPMTRLPHARVIGMPLRREVTTLDRARLRPEALQAFGLRDDAPTVLVTGGSLGAQRLNEAFAGAAGDLRAAGIQVLHLTGAGKGFDPFSPPGSPDSPGSAYPPYPPYPPYVVREYADRMDLAYAAADLVVCRAGANTVCEVSALGLPALYSPLPIGNGEQRFNVADVVAARGAEVVDNDQLTADWVRQVVIPLIGDPRRLSSMASAAAATGQRDADERLADLVALAVAEAGR